MSRIKKLCAALHGEACVIDNAIDLFYFTGLQLSSGKLCVHHEESMLFVDGRYMQVAKEHSPVKVSFDEADALRSFFHARSCDKVYFDGQRMPYDSFLRWKELLHDTKKQLISDKALFQHIHVIKDHNELDRMKMSAHLLWKGYTFLLTQLKSGVTETELARKLEIFCLQQGADGLAFDPIIAFGANSAMPHYHPQNVPLQPGDIVLIDIGVNLNHYHSDMTRVVFFNKGDSKLEKLYRINKQAQAAALALCRPGVKLGMLDRAARDVMSQHRVEDLYVHGLGHGIGLETHEFPRIRWDGVDKDVVLEPGMVFTVEPGLYIPGKGGVRYEDTIAITAAGYENFYPDSGEEPIIL
ncbi:MAG TPA: M24 family metallopeptidase [Rhabdochlamydiaceae bacterium]|jgi:Xaa-Pro aminopeptidase